MFLVVVVVVVELGVLFFVVFCCCCCDFLFCFVFLFVCLIDYYFVKIISDFKI